MNENKGPVKIVECRACGDPLARATRPISLACCTNCEAPAKPVRKHEQRDSWLCEEYYSGSMSITEIAEKYRLSIDGVMRIIEAF